MELAGVKHFIYPKSNSKDFNDFKEKYKTKKIKNIKFTEVSNVYDVIDLIFKIKCNIILYNMALNLSLSIIFKCFHFFTVMLIFTIC